MAEELSYGCGPCTKDKFGVGLRKRKGHIGLVSKFEKALVDESLVMHDQRAKEGMVNTVLFGINVSHKRRKPRKSSSAAAAKKRTSQKLIAAAKTSQKLIAAANTSQKLIAAAKTSQKLIAAATTPTTARSASRKNANSKTVLRRSSKVTVSSPSSSSSS